MMEKIKYHFLKPPIKKDDKWCVGFDGEFLYWNRFELVFDLNKCDCRFASQEDIKFINDKLKRIPDTRKSTKPLKFGVVQEAKKWVNKGSKPKGRDLVKSALTHGELSIYIDKFGLGRVRSAIESMTGIEKAWLWALMDVVNGKEDASSVEDKKYWIWQHKRGLR